ncbi:deoxyribodipyrimidine photo-lyase [Bowmanella yangjiangensis]|uniref:Deoxyribodipyrimidine photo-lyase n=1 Tax=Bowmanella yangjiangensis TaxID=2811230 RepID=A0ABS3D177_9ALTE|nr:deoxyribodipyrimidine photo-lyase [Bowmanella yangjiangensis]MBN7822121.1 deoxyribodipyrimidine photo-lyase [Bowmanella yangjiangensis]
MTALVWLRSDLRTVWHSPLAYATDNHKQVSAVFFVTPLQWQHYGLAPIKLDLLMRRLLALKAELSEKGVQLNLIEVDDFDAIPAALKGLCTEQGITHVYCNAEYELDERRRDQEVKELLGAQQIKIGFFHDTCLVRPDHLLNKQGLPYKVFTPYFHQWLENVRGNLPTPQQWHAPSDSLNFSHSLTTDSNSLTCWLDGSSKDWPCDEGDILNQVQRFLTDKVNDYGEQRDFPAQSGTSGVSPYLSIGAVAPAQLAHEMLVQYGPELLEGQGGAFVWLRELAWRDFYRYVMFHFPHVCRYHCFNDKYDSFAWHNDKSLFDAWSQGQTGYPIVDAAMRCLNATGWMHNRLRMIVASFLCKHLLLPWRWGEDYFMSKLIDGDFASNNGGWQWSASVGTDAAPYFRIFNPAAQGQRYDPDGEFLLQWVPELKKVPRKYLHEPQKWPGASGLDYPRPVVEHKQAVANTKERFSQFLDSVKSSK